MARRMITYPTGRLLGVVDDPASATAASDALVAAGFAVDALEVLVGDEGQDRLGRLGRRPNGLSRVVRVFQFLLMDQTPDFIVFTGRPPAVATRRISPPGAAMATHGGPSGRWNSQD